MSAWFPAKCCKPLPQPTLFPQQCIWMGIPEAPLDGALYARQNRAWVEVSPVLNLAPTTNATPKDGDLWYDGTHLNFFHGGTTTVLV